MVNNERLNEIFRNVHITHFPGRLRRIKAEFYPYRSMRHTVEWNGIRIKAKVSRLFSDAPVHILEIIALLLLSRVYKKKIDRQIRSMYSAYSNQLTYKRQTRKINYEPGGKYYNLSLIYQRLNIMYFNSELQITNIGWSKKNSYTRLGFFDKSRNLIVISKIFDSPLVSHRVLQYLMYHEMLHSRFPEQTVNNRRRIHTPQFRAEERKFPGFYEIQDWININTRRLATNLN